jgi:hypothetical protein
MQSIPVFLHRQSESLVRKIFLGVKAHLVQNREQRDFSICSLCGAMKKTEAL